MGWLLAAMVFQLALSGRLNLYVGFATEAGEPKKTASNVRRDAASARTVRAK